MNIETASGIPPDPICCSIETATSPTENFNEYAENVRVAFQRYRYFHRGLSGCVVHGNIKQRLL